MANTVIALKKSSTPSAEPTTLANGELAINFADGKLFYKNSTGQIVSFTSGSNSFGTVNANGTLIISDTVGDVLTIEAGNNISIVGDAINDKITISATGGGANVAVSTSQIKDLTSNDYVITSVTPVSQVVDSALMSAAFDKANVAFDAANGSSSVAAFDKANSANIVASSAFDKANSANVLAFNTGIGANAFTSATITGANTAVGAGANAFTSATVAGANTAVGAGANSFTSATVAGANTAVGAGANAFTSATIAGANTAVGAGANAYAASIANTIAIQAYNKANSANYYTYLVDANTTAAFAKANAALPNTSGATFNGALSINGVLSPNFGFITSAPANNSVITANASIAVRVDSGFYQTKVATTANGWPENTSFWYHGLISTHTNYGNYYSMQLAADFFNQKLFYRSTNNSGTQSWGKIVHSNDTTANQQFNSVTIGNSVSGTKLSVFGSSNSGITTVTDNTSIVLDMTSNNNFAITLGGSNTFINPTTMNPGQSGVIWISQDSGGSRAPSWGSYWRFPSNTAPTLSTAANSVDAIVYVVRNSTSITAQAILNVG